jgi:serine/threonine-protein kinase
MFTGRLPFAADTPMKVALQQLKEEPPPPSQFWREIPPELERAILTCLAKKPEARFPSVDRLLRVLESLSA